MNEHDAFQPEDASLWRAWREVHDSAAQVAHGADACPAPLELAAFVDGRSSASEADRVRSHVVNCAVCAAVLTDVQAIQQAAEEVHAFVAPQVIERARQLVPVGSPEEIVVRGRYTIRRAIRTGTGWGLAAAASLGIALGGYQLGLAAGPAEGPSEDAVLTAMSFGLIDDAAGDDGAMILLASSTSGGQP